MEIKVVMQIRDVDFGIIEEANEERIKIGKKHGDVLVVKGMIEDDPEGLMTLGIIEGENKAQIAFYKPMDEIEKMLNEGMFSK